MIVVAHLFGSRMEMGPVYKAFDKRSDVLIIEDCAQAQGAKYKNKFVGTFGVSGCFSFYPTKILGTFGDGGMCVTSDSVYYKKLKMLRFYGMEDQYFSLIDGVNSRLDEVHAAILRYKLKKIDEDINRRLIIQLEYNSNIKDSINEEITNFEKKLDIKIKSFKIFKIDKKLNTATIHAYY